MFTNNQVSFVSGGSGGGGGPPSGSGVSGKSSSGIRQSSPSYHHHLGGYAYGQQGNHYPHHQDYGMYPMDTAMAWQAYSGFYRGYDMTTATSAFAESVWPHASHHPFGNPGGGSGGHEGPVNPLDPLHIAATPTLDNNFGPNGDPSSDVCNRDADTPEYKASHFLNGTVGTDHPANRTGATRPSPDSGLTISDGVSSSGSPNQSASSQNNPHGSTLTMGMPGSPGSSPPPGSELTGHGRPQPARSPYEWMKRPNFQNRNQSSKEGRTRTKDKYRVVYSDHQRLELEKEFHYSRYITIRRKAELAQGLGLSERQVKIWFQNRRAKERKQMKKRDELIHKEKLDVAAAAAAGFHHHHAAAAAAAAAQAAAAAAFSVGPTSQMLHHTHHATLSHLQP